MRRVALVGFVACALALLSACGGGGSSSTPTAAGGSAPTSGAQSPGAAAGTPAGSSTALTITSPDDEKFDKKQLTAPAATRVTLTLVNDSDLAHNWHVYKGSDDTKGSLAQTEIITGPNKKDSVTFTTPANPGRYFFRCDVHPTTMTGFLVVQ